MSLIQSLLFLTTLKALQSLAAFLILLWLFQVLGHLSYTTFFLSLMVLGFLLRKVEW